MKSNVKIYDTNGTLLKNGDLIDAEYNDDCGYQIETINGEWCVTNECDKNILIPIENYKPQPYKDGYCLDGWERYTRG
ncbi:MAG: hypothetical protein IKF82_01380 [Bacilli bacterium]|nr:hypothetical protein [Bacilli bacterium]